jgi:L-lactate dehydrogenase complex protein LldE
VALFATCLADRFFADACADTVRILRSFGLEVTVPPGQTCCGQPAYNIGRRQEATRMARHTSNVFTGADPVVLPSGSCGGMIRSFYPRLLACDTVASDDPAAPVATGDAPKGAPSLADRARELSEFLVHDLGVLGPAWSAPGRSHLRLGSGLEGLTVAYHHGCHALRELGIRREPVALLRACGAEVVPWDGDTECCGFGGLFSTKFPEVSAGMADRKLDALDQAADVVASADAGCLLQLSGRARRRGGASDDGGPPFTHLATLLRRGLGI